MQIVMELKVMNAPYSLTSETISEPIPPFWNQGIKVISSTSVKTQSRKATNL